MTPITYTLFPEDALAASRLGFIRIYRKNIFRNALIAIAIAGIVAGASEYLDGFNLPSFLESFLVWASFYVGLFLLLIPVAWFVLLPRKTKKTFKQMPVISREQTLSWDDEAITISSAQGKIRAPFAEFHRWSANEQHIIIYPADHAFYAFPRRIFALQQDFDDLAGLLRRAGVTKI